MNYQFLKKKLVELLIKLKLTFLNGDVREEIKKLTPQKYTSKIENTNNKLFEMKAKDIFDFLKDATFKEITLNLDEIKIDTKLLTLFLMFSEKFNFIYTINKQNYIADNNNTKIHLLNILEGQNSNNIEKYDEIFMPLPKDAELFLDCAFKTANTNATVHMYDFLHENEFPHKSEDAVKQAAQKAGKQIEIISTRKVGQYSPRKYRVCCDFIVK